eukprot:76619_1
MKQLLDCIHTHIMHTFQLKYRLTKHEEQQLHSKESNQFNDDEDETQQNQHRTKRIRKIRQMIEENKEKIDKLFGAEGFANSKFVMVSNEKEEDKKEDDQDAEQEETNDDDTVVDYSFGYKFRYWPYYKHDKKLAQTRAFKTRNCRFELWANKRFPSDSVTSQINANAPISQR